MDEERSNSEETSVDQGRGELEEFASRDELPKDPREWPDGKGKFVTFADGDDQPYGEGDTAKLGPPITHGENGEIFVDGKKVENPDDYRGEPIPLAVERDHGEDDNDTR